MPKIFTDSQSKAKGIYASLSPWSEQTPLPPYPDSEGRFPLSGQKSRWHKLGAILRIALEVTTVVLLGILLWKVWHDSPENQYGTDPRVSSGPFNQHKQFGHNDKFASLSHKQDYLWDIYAPEDTAELQFPPYNSSGLSVDQVYDAGSIAMFHSLHCLAGMRTAYQHMAEGKITLEQLQNSDHVPHCFDYLRQTLLCFADDTFELARDQTGKPTGEIIEGAYDVRTCRDSTKLDKLVAKFGKKRTGP